MKNPWIRRNPFMSMWLSGANTIGGAARGRVSAAVKQEIARTSRGAAAAANDQILEFWSAALGGAPKRRTRKRR